MRDRTTLTAFLLCSLLAGGNAVAVRFSNHELPPLWGATLRFAVATVVLAGIVLILRVRWPRGRALLGSVLYGAFAFGATFGFLYVGLVHVGAGLGQIILALVPLLTFLLAVAQRLERFRWQGLLGASVAVAGIAVIFGDQLGAQVPVASLIAVLLGAASMAESNVIIKFFPRAHPLSTNAVAMGVGCLLLLAATLITAEPLRLPSRLETFLAVGYVSLVGSIAVFSLFLYVIARWSASASSYVMLIIPLIAVLLGAALDRERVTPAYLLGGPLVVVGVYIGAFARSVPWQRRSTAAPAAAAPAADQPQWRTMTPPGGAAVVAPDDWRASPAAEPTVENPGCA